jgi:hypothetical protein
VDVARNTLQKSTADLSNRKSELQNARADLEERRAKLDKNKEAMEALKLKIKNIDSDTMTIEQKAAEVLLNAAAYCFSCKKF